MSNRIFDILIVGSGLSSLVFAEEFLKRNSKLHIISPRFKNKKLVVTTNLTLITKPYRHK